MIPTKRMSQKKNLLLAFDAFGTLFTPKAPVPQQYAVFAERYGIDVSDSQIDMNQTFKKAYKEEAKKNPCYGKAVGMGEEKWWANVISNTMSPYLKDGQKVPPSLVKDLLVHFSTQAGYTMYPDVFPFFRMLREVKNKTSRTPSNRTWKWDKTIVGIVTNSDSRVPGILESFGLTVGPRRVGTQLQRQQDANAADDFNFVVMSYDVGCEKPDPRIFDAAVQMGTEMFEEAEDEGDSAASFEKLFVGDALVEDYRGAVGAGWNAVLLERGDGSPPLGPTDGVQKIESLEALKSWRPPKESQ